MAEIRYHMKEPAVRVLGPGVRYVLWVQGCKKRCPGCIAPDAQSESGGHTVDAGALAWEIAFSKAEGLTISGGEPFLQAKPLAEMIDELAHISAIHGKEMLGIIVYTGYQYEELLKQPQAKELLERIDLLVDGEYIESLNDGKGLRGSSNQRAIPVSDRYLETLEEYVRQERKTEIYYHGSVIHEVGIPDGCRYGKGKEKL